MSAFFHDQGTSIELKWNFWQFRSFVPLEANVTMWSRAATEAFRLVVIAILVSRSGACRAGAVPASGLERILGIRDRYACCLANTVTVSVIALTISSLPLH